MVRKVSFTGAMRVINNYEKFIFFSSSFRDIKNNQILEGLTFGELIQPSGKCWSIEKGMYTQNISDPKFYDKKTPSEYPAQAA